MFSKLQEYLFDVQGRNPGFPWHIILALLLFQFSFFVLTKYLSLFMSLPAVEMFFMKVILSFMFTMAVGYANEYVQKKRGKNNRTDMLEDTFGNLAGCILGSLYIFTVYFLL